MGVLDGRAFHETGPRLSFFDRLHHQGPLSRRQFLAGSLACGLTVGELDRQSARGNPDAAPNPLVRKPAKRVIFVIPNPAHPPAALSGPSPPAFPASASASIYRGWRR
jgi:hypothetical protein